MSFGRDLQYNLLPQVTSADASQRTTCGYPTQKLRLIFLLTLLYHKREVIKFSEKYISRVPNLGVRMCMGMVNKEESKNNFICYTQSTGQS